MGTSAAAAQAGRSFSRTTRASKDAKVQCSREHPRRTNAKRLRSLARCRKRSWNAAGPSSRLEGLEFKKRQVVSKKGWTSRGWWTSTLMQMLIKKPEEDDAEDVTSVTAALQYVARPSLQP